MLSYLTILVALALKCSDMSFIKRPNLKSAFWGYYKLVGKIMDSHIFQNYVCKPAFLVLECAMQAAREKKISMVLPKAGPSTCYNAT